MKIKNETIRRRLFSIWNFLIFWGLAAFTVTCCFLLFFAGANIPASVIRARAGWVFLNVMFLSALFTFVDVIRREYTIKRPLNHILEATARIRQGDFSARIPALHTSGRRSEFDIIIDDFNKMAQELSGIETLRTDFIANVSHELKTPLAVIQNYASLLKDPSLSQDTRMEYAGILTDASRRLSDLITNILKLNKLENQQIYPEARVYDLSEQLCGCLLDFEPLWEKKQLDIEANIDPDIYVKADAELLSLVWNNLISNAVKFTDNKGKVSVSLRKDGEKVVVKVSDNGCGISACAGRHIFEKFYQADNSHATQGNGLGLALVKRVVDIMGGEISVESELGKGSVFTVSLNASVCGTAFE